MSDVFYLRPIAPPTTPAGVIEMSKHAGGCFGLHRVDWVRSFLRSDGARMLCWYRAPDAESVRIALRQLGADVSKAFAGSATALIDDETAKDDSAARIAAEYVFDEQAPVSRSSLVRSLADSGLHPELVIDHRQGVGVVPVVHAGAELNLHR